MHFLDSCLGHKEFRFLFPVLPLAMLVCGSYLHYLTTEAWPEVQSKMAHISDQLKKRVSQGALIGNPDPVMPDASSNTEKSVSVSKSHPMECSVVDEQMKTIGLKQGKKFKSTLEACYSKFIQFSICIKKYLDLLYLKVEYHSKHFWSNPYHIIGALLATNLPLALYTGVLHQRGTLDAMKYISDHSTKTVGDQMMSVMYLMPCHSTPYYGYV